MLLGAEKVVILWVNTEGSLGNITEKKRSIFVTSIRLQQSTNMITSEKVLKVKYVHAYTVENSHI